MSNFSDVEDIQLFQLAKAFKDRNKRVDWKNVSVAMYHCKSHYKRLHERFNTLTRTYGRNLGAFPPRFYSQKVTKARKMIQLSVHEVYDVVLCLFACISQKDIVQKSGKAHQNTGEIQAYGVTQILALCGCDSDDVFSDFGCGIGNVLAQIALQSRVRKCVGVEIQNHLVAMSRVIIGENADRYPALKKIELLAGDIKKIPLIHMATLFQTTILYASNFLFDSSTDLALEEFCIHAAKLRLVITFKKFCPRHRKTCNKLLCKMWKLKCEALVPVHWSHKPNTIYFYEKSVDASEISRSKCFFLA
jgi:hypothetical protein